MGLALHVTSANASTAKMRVLVMNTGFESIGRVVGTRGHWAAEKTVQWLHARPPVYRTTVEYGEPSLASLPARIVSSAATIEAYPDKFLEYV